MDQFQREKWVHKRSPYQTHKHHYENTGSVFERKIGKKGSPYQTHKYHIAEFNLKILDQSQRGKYVGKKGSPY